MNYNHPLWEGHKFNGYKQDPKHYNTSNEEKVRIRSAHSQKENLSEWASLGSGVQYGGHGGPNIDGDNHGKISDRLGLLVDHLNQVNSNLKRESLWEFVQDVDGWMKRMK